MQAPKPKKISVYVFCGYDFDHEKCTRGFSYCKGNYCKKKFCFRTEECKSIFKNTSEILKQRKDGTLERSITEFCSKDCKEVQCLKLIRKNYNIIESSQIYIQNMKKEMKKLFFPGRRITRLVRVIFSQLGTQPMLQKKKKRID